MEIFIMDNFKMIKNKVKEYNIVKMVHIMMENGKIIWEMDKVNVNGMIKR